MTRVSSASSSPTSSVEPSASAASSSSRLEMLLDPGSATLPAARAIGRTVSTAGQFAGAVAGSLTVDRLRRRGAPGPARQFKHVGQARTVARIDRALKVVEQRAIAL